MFFKRIPGWLAAIALLTPFGGCGDGPNVVAVSGLVTHQGAPLPGVLVNFQPDQGRPSWGVTDESGRYTLYYSRDQQGGLVGRHKVWISVMETDPPPGINPQRPDMAALLQKYGAESASPLMIEVSQPTDSLHIALD